VNLKYLFYGAIVATTLQLKSAEVNGQPGQHAQGRTEQEGKLVLTVNQLQEIIAQVTLQSGLGPSEFESTRQRFELFLCLSGLPEKDERRILYDAYSKALEQKNAKEIDRLEPEINLLEKDIDNLREEARKEAKRLELKKITAALVGLLEPNKGPQEK
jgi:hypothetical protein